LNLEFKFFITTYYFGATGIAMVREYKHI